MGRSSVDQATAILLIGSGLIIDASVIGIIIGIPVSLIGIYFLLKPGGVESPL